MPRQPATYESDRCLASPRGGREPTGRRESRGTRRKVAFLVAGAAVALFLSLSAVLFVWPARDRAGNLHASAILVMGGPGARWHVALELAREHAADVMLVSVPSVQWNCPRAHLPGVAIECFRPRPFSTQGEARFAGREARLHRWKSLIVVSSVPQTTRARLRVKRCFGGAVYMVPAEPRLVTWPYEVIYEWGALAKALFWQRGC